MTTETLNISEAQLVEYSQAHNEPSWKNKNKRRNKRKKKTKTKKQKEKKKRE